MSNLRLRYRQVHLDFHTGRDCTDVGADFDGHAFAETAKRGHVNSMTVFAKCHHGFSYYPTKVGTPHPHLQRDLLGEQIEALHRADIRAPVYVSVMWDDLAGEQHPEWVLARKDGTLAMRPPGSGLAPTIDGGLGWTTHDVSSGYADYFLAQVEEICGMYDVDGFFFDICFPLPNYSPWGQAKMRAAGVPIDDDDAAWRYALDQWHAFYARTSALVREHAPDATIFYNGTVTPVMARMLPVQTHFEIESLPTAGHAWGYLHYPLMARQARMYGQEFLGMTGRFHKSWADFGGLKTGAQLDYECGTTVAAGGKISVGDQLHPRGVLDPAVYRLLGHSFGRVERLEPWLHDAVPVAEAAILNQSSSIAGHRGHTDEVDGAAQMLLELGVQFDIADTDADFGRYQLLIIHDGLQLDDELRTKLNAFVAAGGCVMLSGTAALGSDGTWQLDGMPVRYVGAAPTTPSYLRPDAALVGAGELATDYDYAFYGHAHVVQPIEGASSYGELKRALFNRTWEHFTSHAHAPVGDLLHAPIAVRQNNVLYFAAPLFAAYRQHDYWAYREIVRNAMEMLLPQPVLRSNAPGWAEVTLHTQAATVEHSARQIVHIVTYQTRRTLQPIQHADQSAPVAGLQVSVRCDEAPQRAYLAPDGEEVSMTWRDGYAQLTLPPVGPHAVVVLE